MPNTHQNITDLFDDIADAIREQDETTDPIVADTFPARIRAIPSGGGTDGQFFPINMAESVIPTISLTSLSNTATMIDMSGGSYIQNGDFYYDTNRTFTMYYCDFGKTLTSAVITATKTANSNRFRIAFFNEDPSTFITNKSGIGYYPPDENTSSPTGTSRTMMLASPYAARYMIVYLSNENTTTPAPAVAWAEI